MDACVYVSASFVPFVCLSGEACNEGFTEPNGVSLVGSFDHLHADFPFRHNAGTTTTVNDAVLP